MTWNPLPEGTPYKKLQRRFRSRDNELLGRTTLDLVEIGGTVNVAGRVTLTGGLESTNLELANAGTNPSVSDGPDDYPEGWSHNNLSGATGWPIVTGWVETFIDTSTQRAHQVVRGKTASKSFERHWASTSAWDNWRLTTPIKTRHATSTQYDIVTANTPEVARTVVISTLPSSSFEAEVHATWQMWVTNPSATCNNRAYVSISLDGGSTWTSGLKQLDHISGSGEFGSLTVHALKGGAVTGDIHVRLTAQSSHAATKVDDMDLIVTVGTNY